MEQSIGKMGKSSSIPYKVVNVVGHVFFRLLDVRTGTVLLSLKHSNVLPHCSDAEDSGLQVLQR